MTVLWWPDAEKKHEAVPGTRRVILLEPGTILTRYSRLNAHRDAGWWFEPVGVAKEKRLVNPFDKTLSLHQYIVQKPFHVEQSLATPWFDLLGRGKQFQIMDGIVDELEDIRRYTISDLVSVGIIQEIDANGQPILMSESSRPETKMVETIEELAYCPDSIYVVKKFKAIFRKFDGRIEPVSSYHKAFYDFQLKLFDLARKDTSALDAKGQFLQRLFLGDNLFDMNEIKAICSEQVDFDFSPSNIIHWTDGDLSNADQVRSIHKVDDEEWSVMFWERGSRTELIRLFQLRNLYTYLASFYFENA